MAAPVDEGARAPIISVRTEILRDRFNPQLLVHVTAEDGWSGTGETWWGTYQPQAAPGAPVQPIASMIDDVLSPMCAGADSEDIEDSSRVRVTAQAMVAKRNDTALEQIVGRLSLEPQVSGATWQVDRSIPEA